jgi:hypothetical protein
LQIGGAPVRRARPHLADLRRNRAMLLRRGRQSGIFFLAGARHAGGRCERFFDFFDHPVRVTFAAKFITDFPTCERGSVGAQMMQPFQNGEIALHR